MVQVTVTFDLSNETDREGNATMDIKLAHIVLFALQNLDKPNPLTVAR